ncbi:helix-turn-helix domain-containing protein [Aquirhabdus parva]|uniref:XRE family transcriptional regulator n=1 Tax=Aquirhabdus parva TaxID=2283318 RepID=A0A345P9D1_9GAMM|nr:helix-turn-helix transcriptional regulator [Aquirhabdus parva]AXI03890.1 XRE family transcriptional regulator [Aquirhabdus parva]
MDKRFKPQTPEQEYEKRINLTKVIKANPDWTIAQIVTYIRSELHLTLKEMSKFCKVSEKTLQKLEDGFDNPTLDTLNRVLGRFGMKMGVVFIE